MIIIGLAITAALILLVVKIELTEERIMATIEELNTAIEELNTKVEEDITQTAAVIVAVNKLIEKLGATTLPADVSAQITAIQAITAKVASDNPAVQAAIDAAGTATA
jgi:uncharacterized protein YoxC